MAALMQASGDTLKSEPMTLTFMHVRGAKAIIVSVVLVVLMHDVQRNLDLWQRTS